MCLPIDDSVVPPKGTVFAYKVFSYRQDKTGKERLAWWAFKYKRSRIVPRGRWLRTGHPGFHVFATRAGAKFYGNPDPVLRVRIRGHKVGCSWAQHEAYRAREIFVPRQRRRK